MLDKFQLKNGAMRAQKRKVSQQLRHKQENGDNLHEVDFDHLKIENRQFLDRIDERTKVHAYMQTAIRTGIPLALSNR